ncbi:MAG TPA: TIGR03619 family F420-dependent LLM class oxidoreductase [Solirubrobacteraceae bacterium]
MTALQLGAVIPCDGVGNDPIVLRDFAQAAEDLGYAWIETFDHVLGAEHADRDPALPPLYTEDNAFHEPLVTLAFLAAATDRIGLSTSILVLPQRQTALVAKQAAELQLLSGNRFRMGIGTGWNWVEYRALGVSWSERAARLEEQVAVLRELFSRPRGVTFKGTYHDLERVSVNPLPSAPPEIWFGGGVTAVFDRAARLGDGFIVPMWGGARAGPARGDPRAARRARPPGRRLPDRDGGRRHARPGRAACRGGGVGGGGRNPPRAAQRRRHVPPLRRAPQRLDEPRPVHCGSGEFAEAVR